MSEYSLHTDKITNMNPSPGSVPSFPVLSPIASNSWPLRHACFQNSTTIDFSVVDNTYYQAEFTVSLEKSHRTEDNSFTSITPFHVFNMRTSYGAIYRFAVGKPLSVYGETVIFQCFGRSLLTGIHHYNQPGIVRVATDIVHIPDGYPTLPAASRTIHDAVDNSWNLITPANRLSGDLVFDPVPLGVRISQVNHRLASVFADEQARDAMRMEVKEEDEVNDGRDRRGSEQGWAVS